ncbi:unnamed protein product [Ectocarpus sp. CCAP 1310/34]|nr:unnamed protein product [Ectocarpus sp. CCAP 1310/34]
MCAAAHEFRRESLPGQGAEGELECPVTSALTEFEAVVGSSK